MIYAVYVVAGNTPGAPEGSIYRPGFDRFLSTLKEFNPSECGNQIRLVLVNSHDGLTDEMRAQVGGPFTEIKYSGMGWDSGAQQYVAKQLSDPSDWMICFSSWAYFTRGGWLDRYVEAIKTDDLGMYGSMTSNEVRPHLRGTGYCCRCDLLAQYPHLIDSREDSFLYESGPESLTNWHMNHSDGGAYLVTWDGIYRPSEFRLPPNIFRRGDQSNLINRDKHSLIYDLAVDRERKRLEVLSDTGVDLGQ